MILFSLQFPVSPLLPHPNPSLKNFQNLIKTLLLSHIFVSYGGIMELDPGLSTSVQRWKCILAKTTAHGTSTQGPSFPSHHQTMF